MNSTKLSQSSFTRSTRRGKAMLSAAIAGVGLFLGLAAFSADAKADLIDCQISATWYDDYTGGRLMMFCNGNLATQFIANHAEPACGGGSNKSLDTLKVWASMSSAFQLANHHVIIDFNQPFAGTGPSCNIRTINNIRSVP
jgi:hypothetical protein